MATVPFGNAKITLIGSPTEQLDGGLPALLPWLVLGVGDLLALISGGTLEYVLRGRRLAERLAAEQSNIAGTLQRALLPEIQPLEGMLVAARYLPGVAGLDVGGDWFDVIHCGPDRCIFVVGDVSGRGLQAATTMANLRFAARAFVSEGHSLVDVLSKLSSMWDFDRGQQFATVLIGEVDVTGHQLVLASAGHLPPLLVTPNYTEFLEVPVGTPIGISPKDYRATRAMDIPPGATLLAFTDGLVERRTEAVDEGLDRLRVTAAHHMGPIDEMLDNILGAIIPGGAQDDTVILGMQWQG